MAIGQCDFQKCAVTTTPMKLTHANIHDQRCVLVIERDAIADRAICGLNAWRSDSRGKSRRLVEPGSAGTKTDHAYFRTLH